MKRTEVNQRLWAYIKRKNLQDPKNRRNVIPDERLMRIFGGRHPVSMFKIPELLSLHLKRRT